MTDFNDQKLRIATRVVRDLKGTLHGNLRAVGLCGSVARRVAERYSDIDHIVLVKEVSRRLVRYRIIDETYCSLIFETWASALEQLTIPHHELPEILGGFTKILPIYDPQDLLRKLERRARQIPARIFRESAKLALIHSYEDFCRAKNSYLKDDYVVLKDSILGVTHSAALVIAGLNHRSFSSDKEIFKAHKKFSKVPKRFQTMEQLRYGNIPRRKLFPKFLEFYLDLVEFSKNEGVSFPVDSETLKALNQNFEL